MSPREGDGDVSAEASRRNDDWTARWKGTHEHRIEAGAIGAEIERIHQVLTSHGIAVADDERAVNAFGPYTLEALSAFQCDRGMPATGDVDALQ